MSSHRKFAAREQALAIEWGAEVLTGRIWTLGARVGAGESGSFWISRDDGVRAIAKPAFQNGDVPRAAHERIASELARLLDLPVPSVQLWFDPHSGEKYALSAFPFAEPITWREAGRLGILSATYRSNALPILAAGNVFHTWINDCDHAGHDENLLVDARAGEDAPSIAFIDHAFSLSMNWHVDTPCIQISPYYAPVDELPLGEIERVIQRIVALPSHLIARVVAQVPEAYLPAAKASTIRDCLEMRKQQLPAAFGLV